MTDYVCRSCGKTLARLENGVAVVSHARRIVLCRLYEATCDRCGTLTRFEEIPAAPTQKKGRINAERMGDAAGRDF